ncbi:sensor histidine kinase [Caulobacter soli]|uniref:sensor histidine kinase n=1 Tax=Caulobacter soli TaxID=2708539 RepID=UPI0013EE2034|nr:ATP-binding protein [Caulobacter soli]
MELTHYSPAGSSSLPRVGEDPCWRFSIAVARPLLAEAALGATADPVWHQDRLERALDAVRVLDVNDAAIRLFGLAGDRERLTARPIASLWPEQGRAALADLLSALAAGGPQATETREIGVLGPLTDVVLTGWRAGDARCSDTVFVRISGTENPSSTVLELMASQDRYHNMISALPLPLLQVDARPAGRIFDRLRANGITDIDAYLREHPELVEIACDIVLVTDANKEAVALLGARDRSQLIGPVAYVFTGTPGSGRRVTIAHFLGLRNYVEAFKIKSFDGRLLDVTLMMTFPVAGERLDTTLIMMVDNTARLGAEARLRQVETDFRHAARLSTLGELTASIAHEVKQPLSAILTNSETSQRWLDRDEPNLPKVRQLTERISASARRASDIIERIQDMAGKREPVRTRLDFNEVVRQALVFIRHESDDKSVKVALAFGGGLPPILGDRVQLQQVVVNLLVNSIQAMRLTDRDQRDITLATDVDDAGRARLTVRDSGPGIPPDDLERVFEGFFSTKEDGMGIGLAICQSIIAAHGGTITAANHPEGGAVFSVVIPAAAQT